jgi:hypothetical protein
MRRITSPLHAPGAIPRQARDEAAPWQVSGTGGAILPPRGGAFLFLRPQAPGGRIRAPGSSHELGPAPHPELVEGRDCRGQGVEVKKQGQQAPWAPEGRCNLGGATARHCGGLAIRCTIPAPSRAVSVSRI